MRGAVSAFVFALACAPAWSQNPRPAPIDIANEPHHALLLQNGKIRAFLLKLQPGEATLPHSHKHFYVYLSLRPATIGNEVRGRRTVNTQLEAGELHTSNGGFTLAERNNSSEPAAVLVVEALNPAATGFTEPMGGFRYHDAAFGPILEASALRGYAMTIAVGGRIEAHPENYYRLVIAISDLKLHESTVGQPPSELQMKSGDIQWIPRGTSHSTVNTGTSPATFITLELPGV